jgi:hypothetical protein
MHRQNSQINPPKKSSKIPQQICTRERANALTICKPRWVLAYKPTVVALTRDATPAGLP